MSHISFPVNSLLSIFPSHLRKNQFMKINTECRVNSDCVHVSLLLFSRGLIVFTCHICFIPSNLIFPRYWEHLFSPRPRMEVLERVHFLSNPLMISSLRRSRGAALRKPRHEMGPLFAARLRVLLYLRDAAAPLNKHSRQRITLNSGDM